MDYSLVPLLVQQNYILALSGSREPAGKVGRLSEAAAALSDLDIISDSVRRDGNWALLPAQGMLTVRAGAHARGAMGFPTFPEWLGKYSATNKKRRLCAELVTHTNECISGGFEAMRLSYASALRDRLLHPILNKGGAEGAQETIALMDEYGLSRDDLFENLRDLQLPTGGPDPFTQIDTKAKAAFTRLYNSGVHKSQALGPDQGKASKKRKAAAVDEPPAELAAEEEEATPSAEEDTEEEADLSAFKPKAKGKGKGKAAADDGDSKGKGKATASKAGKKKAAKKK